MKKWIIAAAFVILALPLQAQNPTDPEELLKAINAWYSEQLKQARDNNTQPDVRKLSEERTAKAKAAVMGVELDKTPEAKCLALAQLYQIAAMQKEMTGAAKRFLTSNPEPNPKYTAQSLLLTGLRAAGDAEGIRATLSDIKPPTPVAAASLASMTARSYAQTVAEKLGIDAALALIAQIEKLVPFDQLTSERDKQMASGTIASIAMGRSELYSNAKRQDEALKALEEGLKRLPAGDRAARQLESKLRLARLPGSAAPEAKFDRHYGEFTSLADLKGKVVVLDFTAHW